MQALVHIVDDDAAVRDAVTGLLASIDIEAAGYASAQTFLEQGSTARPGCILLDLRMPDMSGLDMQRQLVRYGHLKPVIFLSGHGDVEVAVAAMRQGAVGFLTKPLAGEALLEKVREAIEQDRAQQAAQNDLASIRARLALLTRRETQVIERVVAGDVNRQIAERLGISQKTVELHRGHVMTKMRAASLAELVRLCMRVELSDAGPGGARTG